MERNNGVQYYYHRQIFPSTTADKENFEANREVSWQVSSSGQHAFVPQGSNLVFRWLGTSRHARESSHGPLCPCPSPLAGRSKQATRNLAGAPAGARGQQQGCIDSMRLPLGMLQG